MYEISTIGDLTPPPAPVAATETAVSAPLVAVVALAGIVIGALGFWALRKYA